jgi:hypothetical protein
LLLLVLMFEKEFRRCEGGSRFTAEKKNMDRDVAKLERLMEMMASC